jgi:hypothetical protein
MHPEHMGTHGRPQQQAQLRTPSTAEAAARQRNLLSGLRLKLQPGAALQAAHACAEQAATRRKSCALPGMTSRPLRALANQGAVTRVTGIVARLCRTTAYLPAMRQRERCGVSHSAC